MRDKSNIFGDLPKKPIKQKVEDNRLVERVKSENLYPFKRGSFETYENFRKRLTDSFQYDISIGTVTLNDKNYDVETKKFFLNIQYQKWFQQLCSLETSNRFYIEIEPNEAQSLYFDYENYELVAQFEVDCECGIFVNMDTNVNVLIQKMWLVAKSKNIMSNNGFKNLIWDKEEGYLSFTSYQYYKTLCNNFSLKKYNHNQWIKNKKENEKRMKILKKEQELSQRKNDIKRILLTIIIFISFPLLSLLSFFLWGYFAQFLEHGAWYVNLGSFIFCMFFGLLQLICNLSMLLTIIGPFIGDGFLPFNMAKDIIK